MLWRGGENVGRAVPWLLFVPGEAIRFQVNP